MNATATTISVPVFIDAAYNHGLVTVSVYNTVERTESDVCNFSNAANALNYAFMLKKRHGLIIARRAMDLIRWAVERTGAISTRAALRAEAAKAVGEATQAEEPKPAPEVIKTKATDTPLMKQYKSMKKKHPDAVLLFRVGDFYETFAEDAVIASDILGITLTRRRSGKGSIELAGFPHHALDTYLPKLVRAGKRVAICEQLEDVKTKTPECEAVEPTEK